MAIFQRNMHSCHLSQAQGVQLFTRSRQTQSRFRGKALATTWSSMNSNTQCSLYRQHIHVKNIFHNKHKLALHSRQLVCDFGQVRRWGLKCWCHPLNACNLVGLPTVQPVSTWHMSFRTFFVAGPTVFNSLPPKIRLSHSIDIFKHHLKTHLFTTP